MLVEKLHQLCEKLSSSQGFYGRLLRRLDEMSDDELSQLNDEMSESLSDDCDELDIIMWLEG